MVLQFSQPVAAGLTFQNDSSPPPSGRINISSFMINGVPWEPFGVYTIALNERLLGFLGSLEIDLSGRIKDELSTYPFAEIVEEN